MAVINMKSSTFPAIDEKYCPEAGMYLLGGAGVGGGAGGGGGGAHPPSPGQRGGCYFS